MLVSHGYLRRSSKVLYTFCSKVPLCTVVTRTHTFQLEQLIAPMMISPNMYFGGSDSNVARNRFADANGSMRLPIMLICDSSDLWAFLQTIGLSNRLNDSEKYSHSRCTLSPAFTISTCPLLTICMSHTKRENQRSGFNDSIVTKVISPIYLPGELCEWNLELTFKINYM